MLGKRGQARVIKLIAVSLRAPYDLSLLAENSLRIATYHSDVYRDNEGKLQGTAFISLAKLLAGRLPLHGRLPVTLSTNAIGSRDRSSFPEQDVWRQQFATAVWPLVSC